MEYPTILFICRANVGRSQIAEGLYNHIYGKGMAFSLAGCEDRKEKYHGKPSESIIDFMKEYSGIDLSEQKILYLCDISEEILSNIEEVIFLYDPTQEKGCDAECMKNKNTPYEYFIKTNISIRIFPIPDPFERGEAGYVLIYNTINSLVASL